MLLTLRRLRDTRFRFSPMQSEIVSLAWPMASAMLGETVMGLVDTKLVGGLGPAALGGVGVASSWLQLSFISLIGLMRGVKVCTAHAVGRGNAHHTARYAQSGLVMGLVFGSLAALVMQGAGSLLGGLGIKADMIAPAQDFLSARAWGLPAACALAALVEHRQGLGDVRLPMMVGLWGNVLNAGLAYCLIYGHCGLPAMGVTGAGLGTSITEGVQFAALGGITLAGFWRRQLQRRHAMHTMAPPRPPLPWATALRELVAVGLPTGLHLGCECLAFVAFTAILGSLGDADVAAHQIAAAITRLAYLFGAAIGEAACILVGRALGAGQLQRADEAVRASIHVATSLMVGCGLLLALSGRLLAPLFTDDVALQRLITKVLCVAAAFQVLDATNVVMRAALRGAKDVRVTAIIGITLLWTCVPSTVFVLGKVMGLGVVGGWLGFVLCTGLSALLFTRRWQRGSWRQGFCVAGVSTAA